MSHKSHGSAGICIGASSVSFVNLIRENDFLKIESFDVIPHHGKPREVLKDLFPDKIPENLAVTGKKFRHLLNLPSISEAEAIENSLDYLNLKTDLVISAGGENFIVYSVNSESKISNVFTGNKCASGTGEFFLQQIRRMNLDLQTASEFSVHGDPYNISGRCSVFCKSDCTHALNKGINKEDVVAGLTRMMADKIKELIQRVSYNKAILIGGTSQNKGMVKFLKMDIHGLMIPEQASYFEALGAAVYAAGKEPVAVQKNNLFKKTASSFSFHSRLSHSINKVVINDSLRGIAGKNDDCILGLDVGSTTTKAVMIRISDNSIVASEYLRTNGDPVAASIECYSSLKTQIEVPVRIIGMGVTGSGRHIAGLHALTKGVINEIIAHATAAVHFDKDVDTIFEIGGQDAKYTYITGGVPSDYAMNEACSAGTGSFLEESAMESLRVNYKEIGDLALNGENPPNFNDQCAAFISSDIKTALQEGLGKENILAGLVYSICINYINRVKGSRPAGKKIFMQGGVCYNKAVPVAMAAITGKEIIVPPDPGLMGAFGVALEIKKRLELGLIPEKEFNLEELINRTVEYEKSFECKGGQEKCDLKCCISLIKIEGKTFPFGGACNKYYNLLTEHKGKSNGVNYVELRQKLVFDTHIYPANLDSDSPSIGISKSFLTNTYYPLYYNFFTQLGYRVILGDVPEKSGRDKKEAAFCYPAELAHGFFENLLDKNPDIIFLPHITEVMNSDKSSANKTCVLLQSENYYLRRAFKEELENVKIISPVINFSENSEKLKMDFLKIGLQLGSSKAESSAAFDFAYSTLVDMISDFRNIGEEIINNLREDNDKIGIVLFGRSYNAYAVEANLSIPRKFSSRDIDIIPYDFLNFESFKGYNHMYWGTGKQILKAAEYVKNHDQLFGAFITNFSCGPDSFILNYFRNIMGRKPSLTLELDSHTADAGINTRIEAALDIIKSYIQINKNGGLEKEEDTFVPLEISNFVDIIDNEGKTHSIYDDHVKMLIPNMGRLAAEAFAASLRYCGVNAEALPPYTNDTLKKGKGASLCKECLPLLLNAGSMLEYAEEHHEKNDILLFFMANSEGPCRLGQYNVFLDDLIRKKKIKNAGVFTLSDEDSYVGLGNKFISRSWTAITVADVMSNIQNAIRAIAVDVPKALELFQEEWNSIVTIIENGGLKEIFEQLGRSAAVLNKIERKESIKDAKKIALVGEIFVRHDEFSRMDLISKLSSKGFVVKVAPIGEYIYYSNYLEKRKIRNNGNLLKDKLMFQIRDFEQVRIEKNIKENLSRSGFYEYEIFDIEGIIQRAEHLVRPELEGEAILTIGSSLVEIINHVSGVIAIGPFGCMPSRVAEAILNKEMTLEGKGIAEGKFIENAEGKNKFLPFLSIETDGNPFPQIINSKIEIFLLQSERLHDELKNQNKLQGSVSNQLIRSIIEYYEGIEVPGLPPESFYRKIFS